MNFARLDSQRMNGDSPGTHLLLDHPSPLRPRLPRVISLVFPCAHPAADTISEEFASSLTAETTASVLLVRFDLSARNSARDREQVYLNGEFHMPPRMRRSTSGFHFLSIRVAQESPSPEGIVSLVSQLCRRFGHVVIEVPLLDLSAGWQKECFLRSDLVHLFVQAYAEQLIRAEELACSLKHSDQRQRPEIKLVGCLEENEPGASLENLIPPITMPMDFLVRGCPRPAEATTAPGRMFRADLRRLARAAAGRLVGLALSSGAAKGFAHIGVIQVLEENSIEVDVVAGASMGAYVGSIWAHGSDGGGMERLAREMEGRWALWSLIDPVFPPRQGFLRGFAVKKRLMRTIGHAHFADLPRPLRVVAGNLATLERKVFACGEVATAVHASSAVPGICVPVTIHGETYIDGGIVDPLPVDVLREMGITRVIAVDAIPGPDLIRSGLDAKRQPARLREGVVRRLFRKAFPVNQQLNYFARGNLFEILMRSVYGAQIRVAEASCRLADVVIRPQICDDRWLDYRNPGKFITLGREAALRQFEEIKALVAKDPPNHEWQSAPEPMATPA